MRVRDCSNTEQHWQTVRAVRNGYIQSVDNVALLRLAREHKTIVRMERGIGDFVVHDTMLASARSGGSRSVPGGSSPPCRRPTALTGYRTVYQDCAFGIEQIVDMALRALSPASTIPRRP